MRSNPLSRGKKMKPTLKHRPAVWECMLGTVYAMNEAGRVKYFDYLYADALAYAGITDETEDLRTWKVGPYSYTDGKLTGGEPRKRQTVLWTRKDAS